MYLNRIFVVLVIFIVGITNICASEKKLAYIVSDTSIPFWNIMTKGILNNAQQKEYTLEVYNSNNIKKNEIKNTVTAIKNNVSGIILSPINSSTAVTILKLAKKANIPVVILDIGTDAGEYVSFISSNNKQGAYEIGKVLVSKMQELEWDKNGTVGIVAIPQKRANGKARTQGFMKAINDANIKGAGILQQVDFSYEETYKHTQKLISKNPNLRAIWLQGSDKYQGALDAIQDANKQKDILLLCFDAEPIFLELIPQEILVGAAMQQPYLMGQKAVEVLDDHFHNKKVEKNIQLEILAISKKNIEEKLPTIKRNVLGLQE